MILLFEGLQRPVSFVDCGDLPSIIESLLRGWRSFPREHDAQPSPCITVRGTPEGYQRESLWLDEPVLFKNPVNAACDFLVDFFKAYLESNRGYLCLHCAAVRMEGGLVLFPSAHGAGKSTLAAYLSSLGAGLYADDILFLEPINNHAMASGVLPRLRLPVPPGGKDAFDDFINKRRGPESDRFLYLNLGNGEMASHGETAPIRGVVHLSQGLNPILKEAKKSTLLKHLILGNFSHGMAAAHALERLHSIIDAADRYALEYTELKDAASLLEGAFGPFGSRT